MKVAIVLKSPEFNDTVTEENVIYADAGYKYADKIGKKNVLGVVGDFDSLGAPPEGQNIISLNVEKNFTDGERALRYAVELGAKEIVIYGAYGGKIEHILGNITLLKIASDLGVKAVIKDGQTTTQLIGGKTVINAQKESLFSLIPYGGNCVFKSSLGLYYPLENLTLTPADTRGISNVVKEENVQLEIESGNALAIYKNSI